MRRAPAVAPRPEHPDARAVPRVVRAYAPSTVVRWYRGFVETIELPCAAFLAHAAAIFRAQPVTHVVLTDKEPEDLGYGWGRFNEPHEAGASSIPDELWHEADGAPDDTRWVRANPQDCIDALGLRCVIHGRHLAGLPPLRIAPSAPLTS